MPFPRTLFVLADGARARLVERSPATGDFVTIAEIDARDRLRALRAELRANSPVRSFHRAATEPHAVTREGYFRQAKEAFVAEVAARAAKAARDGGFQDVVVAAPARLVEPLRKGLSGQAHVRGVLERDLTKAPDATLPRWLDRLFLG